MLCHQNLIKSILEIFLEGICEIRLKPTIGKEERGVCLKYILRDGNGNKTLD